MSNDFRAAEYIYKTVPFRYRGKNLSFGLSYGLFSSNSVDKGTAFLLKTLADGSIEQMKRLDTILDIGCGTGVIGICLAAHYPDAGVTMTDRDALALSVTEENCSHNDIHNASVRRGLMFHGLPNKSYDLVVSNLPAKAGAPVLEEFFRHAIRALTPGGICAVVIVLPLADDAVTWIDKAGGRILRDERTSGHAVFHIVAGQPNDGPRDADVGTSADPLSPTVPDTFIRATIRQRLGKRQVELDTVYNLPEFDTPAYSSQNIVQTLDLSRVKGSILFWEPGQGHIPAYIMEWAAGGATRLGELHLAGRDLLSLKISAVNVVKYGIRTHIHHMPSFASVRECCEEAGLGFLYAQYTPISGIHEEENYWETAHALLEPEGTATFSGKSSDVHRLTTKRRYFQIVGDRKYRGSRCILVCKVSSSV